MLFGDPDVGISTLIDPNPASVLTTDDRESAAMLIAKYDLLACRWSTARRLVGIVTVDDAMDVLENEATEDISKMAAVNRRQAVSEGRRVFNFQKRIPWLLLLMVSATFTGRIILHYENALGMYVILAAFIRCSWTPAATPLAGLGDSNTQHIARRDRIQKPNTGRMEGNPGFPALRRNALCRRLHKALLLTGRRSTLP